MPASQIALLGAIAGFTIFIGLPLGRVRAAMPRTKAFLNALAIGILIFLLWDVLTHAWTPTSEALARHHYGTAATSAMVMLVCLGAGLIGLVHIDRWLKRRAARLLPEGPGAATARPAVIPAGPDAAGARAAALSLRCCWSSGSVRTTRRRDSASSRRWRPAGTGRPGPGWRCLA